MCYNMPSCRELSKLTTNMNTIQSTGRPSRNSQGICSVSQHPMGYTASQSDQQGIPVNTPLPRKCPYQKWSRPGLHFSRYTSFPETG